MNETTKKEYQELQLSYCDTKDAFLDGLSLSKEKEQLFEDLLDAYSRMYSYYLRNIVPQQ